MNFGGDHLSLQHTAEKVSVKVPVEFVEHAFEVEDESGPGMGRGQAGQGGV